MKVRELVLAGATGLTVAVAAWGQQPRQGGQPAGADPSQAGTQQAVVETAPLELLPPERYSALVALEPNRRVFIMAVADGILKIMSAQVGDSLRQDQEIAQFDKAEATAKLKIAQAEVKEAEAQTKGRGEFSAGSVAEARLDAAKARADLAQIDLDRCTFRAPFAGRLLTAPLATGQYVTKGQIVAELADYSTLKALVPVDRGAVTPGATLELVVEGKPVTGKVQSVIPLPETHAILRELATSWAAAWVTIPNAQAAYEPGQRVRSPYVPAAPVANVPSRALHRGETEGVGSILVVRSDRVAEVPVRVMGETGDVTQVAGPFRLYDAVIVESSIPLSPGTFIRFGGGATGSVADVTVPPGAAIGAGRVAPIGAPDSALPKASSKTAASPKTKPAAPKGNSRPARGGTPF